MKRKCKRNTRNVVKEIVRSFDLIFCAAVITAAVWIPFRKDQKALAFGLLAFFGVLGAILLFAHRKRKQEEGKRRNAVKRQIQLEKLMLLSDEALQEKLNQFALCIIRGQTIGADSAFSAIRSRAKTVVCVGELNSDAERLFQTYAPETKLILSDEVIDRVRPDVSKAEIEARLHAKAKNRPQLRSLLQNMTGNRYLLLGIGLYALSFVTKYQLYYRLIGSLCFGLSALTTVFRSKKSA